MTCPASRGPYFFVMVAVVLFGILLAAVLALLLARYASNPAIARAEQAERGHRPRERMGVEALGALVTALLGEMGLIVEDLERRGDELRVLATHADPFHQTRYVVFVEAAPPGDLVEQTTIVELAEAVKVDATVGLLMTPFSIDSSGLAGLDGEVELVDGPSLRSLVARHLPARAGELDRYRGFGEPLRRGAAEALAPV